MGARLQCRRAGFSKSEVGEWLCDQGLLADPAGDGVGRAPEPRDAVLAARGVHGDGVVVVLLVLEPVLLDDRDRACADRAHDGDVAEAAARAHQHVADLGRRGAAVRELLQAVVGRVRVPVLGMALPQAGVVVVGQVVPVSVLDALPLHARDIAADVGEAGAHALEVRTVVRRVVVREAVHAVERAGLRTEGERAFLGAERPIGPVLLQRDGREPGAVVLGGRALALVDAATQGQVVAVASADVERAVGRAVLVRGRAVVEDGSIHPVRRELLVVLEVVLSEPGRGRDFPEPALRVGEGGGEAVSLVEELVVDLGEVARLELDPAPELEERAIGLVLAFGARDERREAEKGLEELHGIDSQT